ncbi:MAG: hypothetical protein IH991_15355 [Planctomycetes bacterium]|nr:hypothetical protein [Planctomycetota bacterium]
MDAELCGCALSADYLLVGEYDYRNQRNEEKASDQSRMDVVAMQYFVCPAQHKRANENETEKVDGNYQFAD